MKKTHSLMLTSTLLAAFFAGTATAAEAPATTVFTNGFIYTEDAELPEAEALAIRNDEIIYVGATDSDELAALIDSATEVIDLEGKMMTPSLIDAHTHPATVGMTDWHIVMDDYKDPQEILDYISAYLEEHPAEELPYAYFAYYPSEMFGTEGPHKEDLDAICSDRPILVRDFSDHASWVNSKFIELLDMGDAVYEDENFVKDENGEPTGWVKEFTYENYLDNLYDTVGWYPPDATEDVMNIVTSDLKSWGVTGVFDAYAESETQVKSIHDMDERGELNMYYDMSVVMEDYSDLDEVIETIQYFQDTYHSEHLNIDTVKIFYDGTNELGDSALVDGNQNDPDNHGFLLMDLEETIDTIRKCNDAGIDVHFHLVGDLAFRQVCDAVEALQNELGELNSQVEMCHCEYINPEDYERPAQLGIFINWTPHWSGGYFGTAALQYLGEERYNDMYQFNPLIESGALVTFGSDVYDMSEENRANPYFGMQTAMTRIDIEYPLDDENPMRASEEAKLSLENLLKGYTINAAKQLRVDELTGSLTVGKKANLNVYDCNLFEVDEMEFQYVTPSMVMFEGNFLSR